MNAKTEAVPAIFSAGQQMTAGELMMNPAIMEALYKFATVMADSKFTVPKHLQGNVGDCLAVAMQAALWSMHPFTVAQKTHQVGGTLGYEAQLVNAVVEHSGAIVGGFEYEFKGSGANIECRVGAIRRGRSEITWGEWLSAATVTTKNSPLWKTNPKQQMGYLQVKNWARAFKPGAILGVYTADELEQSLPTERHMGPAEVVQPERPTEYPQADFDKNVDAWAKVIASGRKTLGALAAMVGSKAPLTAAQRDTLAGAVQKLHDSTIDAQPKQQAEPTQQPTKEQGPVITFAQVNTALCKAETQEALDEAADLIGEVSDEQHRRELQDVYEQRMGAMAG